MSNEPTPKAVDALATVLRGSRLSWGTHADRWNDTEWQAAFWREAATLVCAWFAERPTPCPTCDGAEEPA